MTLGWPSDRQIRLLAALVVFVLGAGYALTHAAAWESSAELTLTPQRVGRAARAAVLEAFDRSGTIGTYVELISSRDTLAQADAEGVELEVRAIPDTRVIEISAVGDEDEVQPALGRVLVAAQAGEAKLRDLWRLAVSEEPSDPAPTGATIPMLLFAALLLAAVAAVATPIVVNTVLGERGGRSVDRAPAAPNRQPRRPQRRSASGRKRKPVPP